jgi:hypoxanthine-guanine phosphoribosyltransferase
MPDQERFKYFLQQADQVRRSLAAMENPQVSLEEKKYRLLDIATASMNWEKAYEQLSLTEEECFIRYVIAGKALIILRRVRNEISTTPVEEKKAALLDKVKQLTTELHSSLLSRNLIQEPEILSHLEFEVGDVPIAAMIQNVKTVTSELPEFISYLLDSNEKSLIRKILNVNGKWNSKEVLKQIQDKRVLVVTAMSSGAMIMPFFVDALNKVGVNAELEICCPEVTSSNILDKFRLSEQVLTSPKRAQQIELILILDDVVSHGTTMELMRRAICQKYGSDIPLIVGTPGLV